MLRLSAIIILVFVLIQGSGPVLAGVDGWGEPGDLVVAIVRDDIAAAQLEDMAPLAGLDREADLDIPELGAMVFRLAAGAAPIDEDFLVSLRTIGVIHVEPIIEFRLADLDADPYQGRQWHVTQVGAPDAWLINRGDGATVAVLDSGAACSHPDVPCIDEGLPYTSHYDAVRRRNLTAAQTYDYVNHGTLVAGTIAAPENGIGGVGIAPGAQVSSVRVCYGVACSSLDVAAGIAWTFGRGFDVINMSLGSLQRSDLVCNAAAEAYDRWGTVVVASAGNNGQRGSRSQPSYPGACPLVVSAGATDRGDVLADFSTRREVDIVAPGVGILGPSRSGGYINQNGTSFSAPIVSGALALIVNQAPMWTPRQAIDHLYVTADRTCGPVFNDRLCGHGRVNVSMALRSIMPGALATLTPATGAVDVTPTVTVTETPWWPSATPTPVPTATHIPAVQTAIARNTTPTATVIIGSPTPNNRATPTMLPTIAPTMDPTQAAVATVRAILTELAPTMTPDIEGTLEALTPSPTPTATRSPRERAVATATALYLDGRLWMPYAWRSQTPTPRPPPPTPTLSQPDKRATELGTEYPWTPTPTPAAPWVAREGWTCCPCMDLATGLGVPADDMPDSDWLTWGCCPCTARAVSR